MADKEIVNFRPAPNADIMNALKRTLSNDYQTRIPDAQKANMQASISAIMDNPAHRNEFIYGLINQIGLIIARNTLWTNPLGKFKRGTLTFGDTIEEVQVGLAESYVYDASRDYLEKALFGQETLETQVNWHRINRQVFYKITVNEVMLRRAFQNAESGLSQLVSQIMTAATTSDEWDEFLTTTQLFAEYEKNNGFYKVNVPDVAAMASDAADAKYALRRVRETADNLTFISRRYNAAGMPSAANRDDLELFVTPEFNAAIDVEALAGAFNEDRAKMPARQTVIPAERFGIKGAQAILTTKDFFVMMDTYLNTASQPNPLGLYDNYFLHHHEIISASRFVPAVLFTTEPGTEVIEISSPVTGVNDIVVTDRKGIAIAAGGDIPRGDFYLVQTSAITTGPNDAVVLTLTGANNAATYLGQNGTLFISPEEDSEAITITATAEDDNTKVKTRGFDLDGDVYKLWPRAE